MEAIASDPRFAGLWEELQGQMGKVLAAAHATDWACSGWAYQQAAQRAKSFLVALEKLGPTQHLWGVGVDNGDGTIRAIVTEQNPDMALYAFRETEEYYRGVQGCALCVRAKDGAAWRFAESATCNGKQ